MDYRLVKQFSNNSIDSFFNFFYKIADFGKVLIDLAWAFLDIWYHFFMIFINAWLYVYYFALFIIDKLTVTGLFTQKAKARHVMGDGSVFTSGSLRPRRIEIPSAARAAEKVTSAAQSAAKTVAKTVEKAAPSASVRRAPHSAKRSVLKDSIIYVFDIIRRMISAVVRKVMRIVEFLSFRMRPTRDESPSEKKSLIDEYMREYEKKKK